MNPFPCFGLVADIRCADGDLAWALEAVREASKAGVWGVKAQFYTAELLASPSAKPYGALSLNEPKTQREQYAKQLSDGEWGIVAEACERAGIVFFASVFDDCALALSETLSLPLIKIASGDITNRGLLLDVASCGRPVLLSTGAAFEHEIRRAIEWLQPCPVLPLACSLEYPTPPVRAYLRRILQLQTLFGPVGYSNHVPGMNAIVAAKQLGVVLVETHFTVTPGGDGDHAFAVTADDILNADWDVQPDDYMTLLGQPHVLGAHSGELKARTGARRSLHAAFDIQVGDVFTADNLVALRPMPGWEPWRIDFLIGCRAGHAYAQGERIAMDEGAV